MPYDAASQEKTGETGQTRGLHRRVSTQGGILSHCPENEGVVDDLRVTMVMIDRLQLISPRAGASMMAPPSHFVLRCSADLEGVVGRFYRKAIWPEPSDASTSHRPSPPGMCPEYTTVQHRTVHCLRWVEWWVGSAGNGRWNVG